MIEQPPDSGLISKLAHAQQLVRDALAIGEPARRGRVFVSEVVFDERGITVRLPALTTEQSQTELVISPSQIEENSSSRDELCAFLMSQIVPARFGRQLEYVTERRRAVLPVLTKEVDVRSCVSSSFAEEMVRHVLAGRDVVSTGKSASGKTIAATQAALSLARSGWTIEWLDLSEPDRDVWDVLAAVVRSRLDEGVCVYIDDAQANPTELARIALVHNIFSAIPRLRFRVSIIGWTSARQSIVALWPSAALVTVLPERVLRDMASAGLGRNFSLLERQQLEHMASGDLVVAKLAMSFMVQRSRFPNGDELANEALSGLVGADPSFDETDAGILYRTASLSQFEIDASLSHLEQVSKSSVEKLISRRILRRNGQYVSIGHRSTSRLILRGLAHRFPDLNAKWPNPSKLAVEYLRTADTRQLLTTLERLDIARLQRFRHDQHGTKFLVTLWSTLRMLLTALSDACAKDPTWRDDTGSGTLASRVLSEFNFECAASIVAHQRNRWNITKQNELAPVPPPPNERKDFDEIRRCMAEEPVEMLPPYAEATDTIDFDRMHRTWALGFLLGTEATAPTYFPARILALKSIAEKSLLANGSFYPARVPWVTARVLIGLSQIGESVETSHVVRRGCEWLLTEMPAGPCSFGAWNPHTGIWNTVVGTTAMCMNALVRCGVSSDHPMVDLAGNYLMDCRSEWSQAGQEIDCAFALETFLLSGVPWREFTPELLRLIDWAHDPQLWDNVVLDASQSKDESLKIPLITSSMVGIIWSVVKSELPLLLEDLATGTFLPDTMSYTDYKRELQELVRRLDEIKAHVKTNIEQRLMLVSSHQGIGIKSVRDKLNEFRGFSVRCDDALDAAKQLTSQPTGAQFAASFEALLGAVNLLGSDVFGERWQNVN